MTVVAAQGYGQVRFRAEFEVALVVLAAGGLHAAWRRLRGPVADTGSAEGAPGAPDGRSQDGPASLHSDRELVETPSGR